MATPRQVATFKRLARKAHPLWCDARYNESGTKEIDAFNAKVSKIQDSMDAIEAEMTPEQIADVEAWAYQNGLYGTLGTC
jgi:hypothetical protein